MSKESQAIIINLVEEIFSIEYCTLVLIKFIFVKVIYTEYISWTAKIIARQSNAFISIMYVYSFATLFISIIIMTYWTI